MKIQPYVEKLNNSSEYRDFINKNKGAFMIAGFFILDLESGNNIHQIDYYVPSNRKVAAFTLDNKVSLQILETMNKKLPEKLDIRTNVDLDAIKGILEDERKNRNITEEIKKIIAVLQNIKGKKIWNVNCVLTGMEILKAHIEDESKTVLKMEKSSIMDYVKKMPASTLNALSKENKKVETSEETKEKIEKLEKLEEEIEKEKKIYESELQKESKKENKAKTK